MITRFIDGTLIQSAYINALKEDSRDFLVRLLLNGTELSCSVKRLEILKGSCSSSEEFSIGNVFGDSMTVEVLELTDDVKNTILEVQIGLLVEDTWKWIKVGEYYISEVKKNIYGATLTGYGKIVSNSSGTFTEPNNKTLANIGAEIGTELGCNVYFDGSIDTSKVITQSMYGLTTYQALQVLTSVVGGYACETSTGDIKINLYRNSPSLNVDTSYMINLPEVEESDFQITGIQCVVSEASTDDDDTDIPAVEYHQGNPINLPLTNAYMTQYLFTDMATNLIGYSYRPGNIQLSLGDPRLEGNDVLQVTDVDGSIYIIPCHQLRLIYDGGFRNEITAVKATSAENSICSVTPFQDFIQNTNSSFVAVNAELEKIATGIQYFWHDNDGAHICTISQEDYNHMSQGQSCIEVLITSAQIIFRKVTQQASKIYQIYAIYSNSGITLGNYASMTDAGIILGDLSNVHTQMKLDPNLGIKLDDKIVIVSSAASGIVAENTTVKRVCPGLVSSDSQTISFTIPTECLIPEGLSINILFLTANIIGYDGSYVVDGSYYSSGSNRWMGSDYEITGFPAGSSITIDIEKSSTFKKYSTSTPVEPLSSVMVEVFYIMWNKPAV